MTKPQINSLAEIKKLHAEILTDTSATLTRAIRVGELLLEHKSKQKHGEWLLWVDANCPFGRSMAQSYLRIFERRDELKSQMRNSVAHLTVEQQLLTEEKQSTAVPIRTVREAVKTLAAPSRTAPKRSAVPERDKVTPEPKPEPKSKPKSKPTLKDKTGLEIPVETLSMWSRAQEECKTLTALAEDLRATLQDLRDAGDVLYIEIDFTGSIANATQIEMDVDRSIPYAVCHSCNGKVPKGCPTCKGRGFVSKFFWTHCVPEEIRNLRK